MTLPREKVLGAMRRPAELWGTHLGAVFGNMVFTMFAFTATDNLWAYAAALPIHGICVLISKTDPYAFRLIYLKFWLSAESCGNRLLWSCSSRDPNALVRGRFR